MRQRVFYCDHYEIPLPPGHKFPISKYARLRETLAADGIYEITAAQPAPLEPILRVHDPEYVERFLAGTLDPQIMRRIGFPWSPSMVQRTLASVGGTLLATRDAIDYGWGGVLAGGTHHAFRNEGAGFCVFNDLAVAVEELRAQRIAQRIAILDLDVHQGDGTAKIFEDDDDVLTVSLHGRNNFPFRKQRSRIDIEFENGTTDEEYLKKVAEVMPEVADFEPEVMLFQSGVDGLYLDSLGKLALTFEGLIRRDEMVFTFARDHELPVVTTLGGGYSVPIEHTVEAHANTFRTALRIYGM